jgi:hypothetical protein
MCIALWTRFPDNCILNHGGPDLPCQTQISSDKIHCPETPKHIDEPVSPTKKTVLGNHASIYAWEQLCVTRIPGCLPSVSVDALALRVHIDKNATSILIEVKDMMWLPKRLMDDVI